MGLSVIDDPDWATEERTLLEQEIKGRAEAFEGSAVLVEQAVAAEQSHHCLDLLDSLESLFEVEHSLGGAMARVENEVEVFEIGGNMLR